MKDSLNFAKFDSGTLLKRTEYQTLLLFIAETWFNANIYNFDVWTVFFAVKKAVSKFIDVTVWVAMHPVHIAAITSVE